MADSNIEFHEGTTTPPGQESSYSYNPSGGSGSFNGEAFGWSGSDEPDADDSSTTFA